MRVVQVNFISVITSIYAALPLLKATPNSLAFITSSSSATYGIPRLAVYLATKLGVKGLTESLSVEFSRFGVRVADVLPGLIDTAILRNTPNRSAGPQTSAPDLEGTAPKKGMFRLMPASSVAECAWAAYHSKQLHWYVPPEIRRLDILKALAPNFLRAQMAKRFLGGLTAKKD